MKNTTTILFALAALVGSAGCGGLARTSDVYRDDTAKMLQTANDGITTCYNQVLKTDPKAAGSVTAKFVVAPETGKLRRIKIDPARSSAPAPVQECVRQYIGDLALSPPDTQAGVATFSWTFVSKVAPAAAVPPAPAAPSGPALPPTAADPAKPPS